MIRGPAKIISNEFRTVSMHAYEESDPEFASQLQVVMEVNEKLGLGEDPLDILIRQESDTNTTY